MRLPATHFAGNLMWTRQGTVYATWALTALPSGKSDDDLQLVADAHSAFYRSLAGRQVLLRGTLVWTDPVAVVARMIDGLDLTGLDGWAQECEQTIDAIAGLPLGSRLWTLTVPLGVADWKQKARTLVRSATTELCDQLQIPGLRPAEDEIDYYQQAAATLASSWPSPFAHRPVTVAEQLWLLRYAQSRGAEALANPFDVPTAATEQLNGRAGVGEPLLDPAGMTDVDDPKKIRAAAPLRRRWLKIVTDTGTTSYQAGLVLADVPAGGMETPGGEFLGRLDELGVPADIGIRMTIRTRAEGLRRNKRGFTMLNDQADQIDGSPDVASLSAGLQEAARQLIDYHQRLSINTKEVEIEPVVMVSVAAATPEAADQLALDFVQAPGNKEFTWARPVGAEEDIFWAMQPGGRLSMQLNDYRHITTGADFAAAAPMMTSRLGARKGSLLGLNTTTPLLSTVHLDLAGEAERNFSPSIAFVAELGGGKALDLMTPIATPDGWALMRDLSSGDRVFDEQGQPTVVEGVSEVMLGRTCYQVEFSDGSTLTADAQHLWTTLPDAIRSSAAKRNHVVRRRGQTPNLDLADHHATLTGPGWSAYGLTCTTETLRGTLRRGLQANHAIPLTEPLQQPDADLLVDPYFLGCWLGDGHSHIAYITSADPDLIGNVRAAGYTVTKLKGQYLYAVALSTEFSTDSDTEPRVRPCQMCGEPMVCRYAHRRYCNRACAAAARRAGRPAVPTRYCKSCSCELPRSSTGRLCRQCWHTTTLTGRLGSMNLLRNKHIPTLYLRASHTQRQALLAGLLDTDGTVADRGAIEFCVTNRQLAIDTHELACSLGYRPSLREGRATLKGRYISDKWTVSFTTTDEVFRLTRKSEVQRARTQRSSAVRNRLRYVVAVREIPSVPVRCIRVAAPSRLYLAGRSMIPTHNSYAEKKLCGDEIDRGAVGIAIDGSITREWATFARSLTGKTVSIADVQHPEVSLDPLGVLPIHRAGAVLQSFLVKLCDFSATSAEGITLARVLKPTYLKAHNIDSSAQLLTHLAGDCDYGNASAIADKIAVFADPDTAGALADIVFTENLPPLDLTASDMTVFGTHGVKLPTQAELESAHLYNRLGVEKLFGQAFYLLIAKYAHEVCFSDPSRPAVFAVDETWRVTLSEEGAAIVLEFIRDGRKVKAIILLGSHDPDVDFGGETLSGLIGTKIVMRHRNRRLAEKSVAWLGFDPDDRIDLVEKVQGLSPQDKNGVVPPDRRGEAIVVDPMSQFGDLKILPPARRERAEAISSTPPSRTSA